MIDRLQGFARTLLQRLHTALANLAASVLDAVAALTGLYYSKKYAAVVKRLGLRPQADDTSAQQGLIILQIDGLAHSHLQEALTHRRVPNLRRMLERGGYELQRWACGLPSTTPAVQAGIMFGDNRGIPAFRWYDKPGRRSVVCKLPGIAYSLQQQLTLGNPGLLTGGSSYVNIFDGGATNALFTLSALHPRHFFEGVRGAGLAALFLLNPLRVIRIAYLAFKEYGTDVLQRLSARLRGQDYLPILGIFPFLRIFSNIVFREMETFAVLVDIYRGIPAIYATYYSYDEIAHHFGIRSRAALQVLHDIDRCVGQIDRLRRAQLNRPYTLIVLSDHGLTPSRPFYDQYGQTLGQVVASQLDPELRFLEQEDGERNHMFQTRLLLDELRAIESNLGPTASRVARRLRLLVARRLRRSAAAPQWDLSRQHDLVVKSSGSLAHLYLQISGEQMDLSEITAAFPGLLMALLGHPGVWFAAGREGSDTLILSADGVLTLTGQGAVQKEGGHPLSVLPDPSRAAEQVSRILAYAESGDLIVMGRYEPDEDMVTTFERQWASHGGLGGAQDWPFMLLPASVHWDLSHVRNAADLYPLFAAHRHLTPVREEAS